MVEYMSHIWMNKWMRKKRQTRKKVDWQEGRKLYLRLSLQLAFHGVIGCHNLLCMHLQSSLSSYKCMCENRWPRICASRQLPQFPEARCWEEFRVTNLSPSSLRGCNSQAGYYYTQAESHLFLPSSSIPFMWSPKVPHLKDYSPWSGEDVDRAVTDVQGEWRICVWEYFYRLCPGWAVVEPWVWEEQEQVPPTHGHLQGDILLPVSSIHPFRGDPRLLFWNWRPKPHQIIFFPRLRLLKTLRPRSFLEMCK